MILFDMKFGKQKLKNQDLGNILLYGSDIKNKNLKEMILFDMKFGKQKLKN